MIGCVILGWWAGWRWIKADITSMLLMTALTMTP